MITVRALLIEHSEPLELLRSSVRSLPWDADNLFLARPSSRTSSGIRFLLGEMTSSSVHRRMRSASLSSSSCLSSWAHSSAAARSDSNSTNARSVPMILPMT